ncbi:MAG: RNase adapter RapZ [Eggerthellaceae bacterium]
MSEETAGKTADQSVDLQHMRAGHRHRHERRRAHRTMHSFEDLGYFCVDNLPSSLIGNLWSDRHARPARREAPPRRGVRRAQPRLFASLAGELKRC